MPWDGTDTRWDRASALLLALGVGTAALTFTDYGITWDEPNLRLYGERVNAYFAALFGGEGPKRLEFRNLHYYGALYPGLSAWVAGLGFPAYEAQHALNALVAIAGVLGTWKLARLLGGPGAAFWAALLLVLTPRWWGHGFNNPKDIPFAAATIWALYYLVQLSRRLPKPEWSLVLKLGLAVGLACAVRVGGLVILGYLGLAMLVCAASAPARRQPAALGSMAAAFAATLAIAWFAMVISWPWAQQSPLLRPLASLRLMSDFSWELPVLFAGRVLPADALPRSYALHFLWITTPELVGLLVATGLGWLVFARRRALAALAPGAAPGLALVALATVFPFLWVMLIHAQLYDGIRQLLFALPPLCILAGLAWVVSAEALARAPAALRVGALAVLGGWLVWHVSVMVRLHPYQAVYFNQSVGGLAGAYGRYETDYWGSSYREAALALRARLAGWTPADRPVRVALCRVHVVTPPVLAGHYVPEIEMTADPAAADFFVATTRWDCPDRVGGVELLRVERFGVPLAIVEDLRPGAEQADAP